MIVCRRTPGRGHAVGVVEPVGAVTGADGHRENRPALRRRGSAVGHGAAPLGCAARKNGTWRRLPNRRTPLPRLAIAGQTNASAVLKRNASIAFGSCIG